MFGWDFEVDDWSWFWTWNLIMNFVWTKPVTLVLLNSTLGSVVPLVLPILPPTPSGGFGQLFTFENVLQLIWALQANLSIFSILKTMSKSIWAWGSPQFWQWPKERVHFFWKVFSRRKRIWSRVQSENVWAWIVLWRDYPI